LRNGDHVIDTGGNGKSFNLMASSATTDRGDDRTLSPTRDVRLKSGLPDSLNDVFNLLWGSGVRHIYDHGNLLSGLIPKTNAAISIAASV
jgi:hypothetical protein